MEKSGLSPRNPRLWGWLAVSVVMLAVACLLRPVGVDVRQLVSVEAPDSVPMVHSDAVADLNSSSVWCLRRLGFSYYQVARIFELRSAGFVFRSEADLWAVPLMDSLLAASVAPRLVFGGTPSPRPTSPVREYVPFRRRAPRVPLFMLDSVSFFQCGGSVASWDTFMCVSRDYVLHGSAPLDSLARLSPQAFGGLLRANGHRRRVFPAFSGREVASIAPVGVNSADEAALIAMPGIGEATAHAIVEYRERLGGFVSLDQLREVWQVGDRFDVVSCHLVLDSVPLRLVNVNSSNDTRMRRHPYFTPELRRRISTARRARRGAALSASDLHLQADSLGLSPFFWNYVSF